ncbi:MAG: sulfatase, partial [Planctomycetales bacterium]
GASRFALLTGRGPHPSGVTGSNSALYSGKTAIAAEEQSGAQTMPELFRRSGYRTVCIGKISHTPDGKVYRYDGTGDGRPELPGAWDDLATPVGPWKRGWGAFFAYQGGRHREDGQGNRDVMEFQAEKDEDLPDGLMARRAVEKLRELKTAGRPFFMGLGFFKPHLPFVAPKRDWEAMAKIDVPLPPRPGKIDSPRWHGSGEFFKYNFPFEKNRPLKDEHQIAARRAYLACVRYVDRQVGKVLDELDRLELADNTVVVVWGDHGWHLGDSGMWGKHTPFERALRSALIIKAPQATEPGRRCDALVESIDLYPTLIALCEPRFRETRFPLDGESLMPLLTGDRRKVREAAVSYWKNSTSVRTATHRLIASMKNGEADRVELYSLKDGPDPTDNLAASEPELVKKLLSFLPSK